MTNLWVVLKICDVVEAHATALNWTDTFLSICVAKTDLNRNEHLNRNWEEQTTIILHIVQVPMVAQSPYDILYGEWATEKHFCMRWLKSSDVTPFFNPGQYMYRTFA